MSKNIKAIFLDWDMTLARVMGDTSAEDRLRALFQWAGMEYSIGEMQTAVTSARQGLKMNGQSPQTQYDIAKYYQHILRHLGADNTSWAVANYLYDAYSYMPFALCDDSIPMLRHLRKGGYALGIISNHSRLIRPAIEETIGDLIDSNHIFISQELGLYKPTASIFLRAAAALRVPPESCLFVGDNLAIDAIGAVQKGEFNTGLWLDRNESKPPYDLPPHVHRITTLSDVLDYV